jgi:hypothetical protein
MRFGYGEFYDPGDPEAGAVRHARAYFLEQLANLKPEVLSQLREILPLYAAAEPYLHTIRDIIQADLVVMETVEPSDVSSFEEPEVDAWMVNRMVLAPAAPDGALAAPWREVEPLRAALNAWADRIHLNVEWVLDAALETLYVWYTKGVPSTLSWSYWFGNILVSRPVFQFTHPGWWVTQQTRDEAAEAIRSAFEVELNAYLHRIKAAAIARGMRRTSRKRGTRHFEWLVRYQCQGWSQGRIAKHYHAGGKTVADGIADIADRIGLQLRPPGRAGRPRIA